MAHRSYSSLTPTPSPAPGFDTGLAFPLQHFSPWIDSCSHYMTLSFKLELSGIRFQSNYKSIISQPGTSRTVTPARLDQST